MGCDYMTYSKKRVIWCHAGRSLAINPDRLRELLEMNKTIHSSSVYAKVNKATRDSKGLIIEEEIIDDQITYFEFGLIKDESA